MSRARSIPGTAAAVLVVLCSQLLLAEQAATVACLYMPKESPGNPTPELMPHESCATLSKLGEPSIGKRHLEAASYSGGLAVFLIDGHWYYVRPDGTHLRVIPQDNGPDDWSEGLVRVLSNGKIAYANRAFEVVIPGRYDWGWPFRDGHALVCRGCKPGEAEGEHTPLEGGRWGYIDLAGKEVVRVQHSRREAMSIDVPGPAEH